MKTDILIVGSGVSGLYCALNLPESKKITVITKASAEESDSFLAQGGICVLKEQGDYESFFEDTMRAGHYENNTESVELMIRTSPEIIEDLIDLGVRFEREDGRLLYTKEGAHSSPRILFHADETGKEITSVLLKTARARENITIIENFTAVDILENKSGEAVGVIGFGEDGKYIDIYADYTVLATGGIGGLFKHSTNFEHLTGDALAIALERGIELENIDYIQIHPTTLYTTKKGRDFLISESVRGEGAILLNAKGERFVDELLPRDVVTEAIHRQMEMDGTPFVWLSLERVPNEVITTHFRHIYKHCLEEGYDITKEKIPVVPSQHYFMGGIKVNSFSKTSKERLYAVGETACNGVHGKNRLASNSLLESLVFAKRAAFDIAENYCEAVAPATKENDYKKYEGYEEKYRAAVLAAIEKEKKSNE